MDKENSAPSDPKSTISSTSTPSPSPPQPPVAAVAAPNSPPPTNSSISPRNQQFGANFTTLYHSIFPPKTVAILPSPCSASTPSDNLQNSGSSNCSNQSSVAMEHRLNQARLLLEYRQLSDRYDLCRAHLQDLTELTDSLRRENAELRLANAELFKLLNFSSQANSMSNSFRRLGLVDNTVAGSDYAGDENSSYSPTSVMDQNRFERKNPERVWLPKSISVRSSGFLKANQSPAAGNSGPSRSAGHLRVSSPQENSGKVPQRVYLPGIKKEEEPLEFEVYSQGMFKTELCNKWQETGSCPYGDHCQFAHGIAELRPVMRHPRYKTEVCRMVLAGDTCPYGHRCHFRHSLTEQEMMLAHR